MTTQPELWSDGWETEPCSGDDWTDEQLATWLYTRPRPIPGDHGRPASRPTYSRLRRIHTITVNGDLL